MGMEHQAAENAQFESGYSDQPTATPVETKQEPVAPKVQEEAKPDPLQVLADRLDRFEKGHTTLAGQFGRLQASHKEIQDSLATAQAAAKNVSDGPTQAQVKDAAASPAEWAELKASYPEWATATEKLLDSRIPNFDAEAFEARIAKEIAGKTDAMQEKIIHASLNAVFPGWAKEINSPAFETWLKTQPDNIKALTASDEVGDAATLLKMYEKSKTAAPTAAPEPKKDNSPRKERLAAAVTPRGAGGHAPASSELDEFESGYTG